MKKRIFAVLLAGLLMGAVLTTQASASILRTAISEATKPQVVTTEMIGQKADMSGYKYLKDPDHAFVQSTGKDVVAAMDNKETFTVYFGFPGCPWCEEALPVLNQVAKEYKTTVKYVNTRPNPLARTNTEMPDYKLVKDRLGSFFDKNEKGEPQLYVPFVFFIKNGEVVACHAGTVDGHNAHQRKMTSDEVSVLTQLYRTMFAKELA